MRASHRVDVPRGAERDPLVREDGGHVEILVARRRRFVALTIEYGAPPPDAGGRRIDWDRDVFRPTERLLATAEQHAVALTLMPELGQYLSLLQNDPPVARRMEQQWCDAVARGHDVQLHLHPDWLAGARTAGRGDEARRERTFANGLVEVGDLSALLGDLKARLETLLCPVDPSYAVTCFRAGGYGAQQFERLYDALASNGIVCDSSVLAGAASREQGYDYRLAYSAHQPYFASATDPQLRAPPAERAVVELPVFGDGAGMCCRLDGHAAGRFAAMLVRHVNRRGRRPTPAPQRRAAELLRSSLLTLYLALAPARPVVNRLIPKSIAYWLTPLYPPEALTSNEYYVLTGHTGADLDLDAIAAGLRRLREDGRFEFVRLSEMAHAAREELRSAGRPNPREEAEHQVASARGAVLGDERNERQSAFLQELIPVDRTRVLDLGCGAGYWADRIARRGPGMRVSGVDWGREFIDVATRRYGSPRVEFRVADFADLPFDDGTFDCVYADNVLEHAYDVDAVLREVYRVLEDGGILVAAIPSDAYNPRRSNESHTWKTAPHDVRVRLERAGFREIEILEQDAFRRFATMPYPPSNDRMMFVRAWRRAQAAGRTSEESDCNRAAEMSA